MTMNDLEMYDARHPLFGGCPYARLVMLHLERPNLELQHMGRGIF